MANLDDGRLLDESVLKQLFEEGKEDSEKWVPLSEGEIVTVKGAPMVVIDIDTRKQFLVLRGIKFAAEKNG